MKKLTGIVMLLISVNTIITAQETAPPPPSSLNKTEAAKYADTVQPGARRYEDGKWSDSSQRRLNPNYGSDSANDWKRRINQQDTAAPRAEQRLKEKAAIDMEKSGLDSSLSKSNPATTNTKMPVDSSMMADKDKSKQPIDTVKKLGDRIAMKDDKLSVYKGDVETVVTDSYKLDDGTIAMFDGTLKMPSGKTVRLKNGQYINIKPKAKSDAKPAARTKEKST